MLSLLKRVPVALATRCFKTYQDRFTYRLTQIVPGMFEDYEVWQLDKAIQMIPDNAPIIEIGSFCGRSTNLMRYFLDKHKKNNTIFNCDIWNYMFKGMNEKRMVLESPITGNQWADHARTTFMHHTLFFSGHKLPHSFQMPSTEFIPAWQRQETLTDIFGRNVTLGGEVGFCFIDGNHAYDAVKEDFALCDAILMKHGLILFDDSGWPHASPGVAIFMREFKKSHIATGAYEIISQNPHYMVRKLN
jgi:hypothetical protein